MSETEETRFDALNLPAKLQAGVNSAGFEVCTPIQAQTLPRALKGHDVAGQAQTGTGKTAAFALPLLSRLDLDRAEIQAGFDLSDNPQAAAWLDTQLLSDETGE